MGTESLFVGTDAVMTGAHVTASRQARDLRRSIVDVSRLRYDLAHEDAHLQLLTGANSTGMTAYQQVFEWLAGAALPDRRQVPSLPDADLADALLAPHQEIGQRLLHTFRSGASLIRDSRIALLHLLDGILATLRLMLVRVQTALSRRPDALTFVLIMLAACRRYGRREEPSDHAFLHTRRYQTSLGSCLLS